MKVDNICLIKLSLHTSWKKIFVLKFREFIARKKISKDKKLELILQYIHKLKPTKEIIEKMLLQKDSLNIG